VLTPAIDQPKVPVEEWITLQAEILQDAWNRDDPMARAVLRFAGVAHESGELDRYLALEAVAKDHWYADVADAVAHGKDEVDKGFEAAADAVHAGDVETLLTLLDAEPALVRMRSPFPHRQTLLHHVAANGIEVERQLESPANAVDVARLLIERGADVDASCESYGGGTGATTLCLLVSSAHPASAGVQGPLVEELFRGGARLDGVDDDGLPLWTAISYGYTSAAETLARCGARVDNICFAAALGDLHAVKSFFDDDGRVRTGGAHVERIGTRGPVLSADHLVECALIWAAAHDRREVVEFLLTTDPDLGVTEPCFHATALGVARYFGHSELVALLEPRTRAR
jgi:hypothetical protein